MSSVCVVGLGYVGLPLACLCAAKGHQVSGFDIVKEKTDLISSGVSPIMDKALEKNLKTISESSNKINATTDPAVIKNSEAVIICVPTPVHADKTPDLAPLKSAVETVSKNMRKGQLVVVESTIYPGTVEEILRPILEQHSGLKAGVDFSLAHCPERVDPGNKKWTLEKIPRVLGGLTENCANEAKKFYESIISAPTKILSSLKAAEAVKVVENTFRDVNIAFVNELAQSFDKAGIDIVEVIKGASTKPFSFLAHYPGCGVGGHCIPVDPYYLISKAEENGFKHTFLSLARQINNSMPSYTIGLLEGIAGGSLQGAKVGVLGIAYKPNVDDVRESPAAEIINELKQKGAQVNAFDPNVPAKSTVKSIKSLLKSSDYIVLATAHKQFLKITAEQLKEAGVKAVVDGRNCLNKKAIEAAGIKYKGIGC